MLETAAGADQPSNLSNAVAYNAPGLPSFAAAGVVGGPRHAYFA
jgi:hypothetical protein